ncbi:MAG: type II toxin-antitoxin system death-on-curing family toxin [bacterium]
MNKISFLTLEEILQIHNDIITNFGGASGLRDLGLLLSAIHMPKSSFSGNFLHPDIYEMSAAYIFHIIKNHPFIDGNKRTGLISGILFLENNQIKLKLSQRKLFNLGLDVANSKLNKKAISGILKESSVTSKS